MTRLNEVMAVLQAQANPANVEGMTRFGISATNTLGISVYVLRDMAKAYRHDHNLALALWETGVHEARLMAAFVGNPKQMTEAQMEAWVVNIDSWDVCDQVCSNLFDQTPFAYAKAVEWSARPEEFVKRAGFVLMAALAVHDRKAPDEKLAAFLPIIEREAGDARNFVRKAVNWALRQIGKRNLALNAQAIECARRIEAQDSKTARWVAKDALRELTSEKMQAKLAGKKRG